jgi:hypothetical protein
MTSSPLFLLSLYFLLLFVCVFTWSRTKQGRKKLQKDAQRPLLTAIKQVEDKKQESPAVASGH